MRVPELLGRYEDRVRINIFRWGKTNNSGTQIEYYKTTRYKERGKECVTVTESEKVSEWSAEFP